jgi:hypothetical protein
VLSCSSIFDSLTYRIFVLTSFITCHRCSLLLGRPPARPPDGSGSRRAAASCKESKSGQLSSSSSSFYLCPFFLAPASSERLKLIYFDLGSSVLTIPRGNCRIEKEWRKRLEVALVSLALPGRANCPECLRCSRVGEKKQAFLLIWLVACLTYTPFSLVDNAKTMRYILLTGTSAQKAVVPGAKKQLIQKRRNIRSSRVGRGGRTHCEPGTPGSPGSAVCQNQTRFAA